MGSQITDISVSLLIRAEKLSGMPPLMTGLRYWKEELNQIERKLPPNPLQGMDCTAEVRRFCLEPF